MKERSNDLSPERQAAVAHALGVGAVKYADLSTERARDYVFDWDRMLAFEGDTGPYLQYAHARVRSIFRRAGVAPPAPGAVPLLGEPQERALALQLLGFAAAVEATAETCSPSKLCTYLFELATSFTTFYEACRVLVDDEAVRDSQARAVRPHGPGAGARALPAGHRGARADVTAGRAGPYPLPGTSGAGPPGGLHDGEPQTHKESQRNGSERHVGDRHRRGVRARPGHLTSAGRAGRARGGGRPPGGQGRAAGQGDRRPVRADRRHQPRAGDQPPWTPPSRWRRSSRW